MRERNDLLASIADTIKDYREGEIPRPTPDHVDRWIYQFDDAVQIPLLREIDHVLQETYFSNSDVSGFFARQIEHERLAGENPCDFWQAAHVFDIQQQGHSQREIRELFGEMLKEQCHLEIDQCGSPGGAFVYLDDILFSGGRVRSDLSSWIANEAPARTTVHILVIAAHRLGEWHCTKTLEKVATDKGVELDLHCWAAVRLENRKRYRNASEVLWPVEIPEHPGVQDYMAEEQKFPFEPRQPGGKLKNAIFSSEEGRQLLERELLLAGIRIRSFCQNPSPALRPLGFSLFGLGFGSTMVTFRNCPNNCPLALWWGDPDAPPGHPFRKWRPLLPRKTYASEEDIDESLF
jgi:hypothetical protein